MPKAKLLRNVARMTFSVVEKPALVLGKQELQKYSQIKNNMGGMSHQNILLGWGAGRSWVCYQLFLVLLLFS